MRFNEERTVANLYLNLKGNKKKKDDWITIATDLRKLSNFYGSARKTAEKLGVSYELVRTILKILELPKEAQKLIKEGKILYDAAQRLARVGGYSRQIEVAQAIAGLSAHQARDVIQYAKSNPDSNLGDFKDRVAAPKPEKQEIHLTVLPLNRGTFDRLQAHSRREKISTQKLIMSIIDEWLSRKVKNR